MNTICVENVNNFIFKKIKLIRTENCSLPLPEKLRFEAKHCLDPQEPSLTTLQKSRVEFTLGSAIDSLLSSLDFI